ncbi:MAG: GNAT family N-acetyltransferase [Myxococcales bacterium]
MAATAQAAAPTAVIVAHRAAWAALRPEWNRLAESSPVDCPMIRHEWFSAFADGFAPGRPLHVVAVYRDGRLTAAAALLRRSASYRGLRHVCLTALANPHSSRFDVLAESPADLRALWQALRSAGGWDAIELRDVPEAGRAVELVELARQEGFATGAWESMQTPYVKLDERKISAKLGQNLRRRRRRLEELGAVEVREITGGEELDAFLERAFALEASGWKGREGTAIACQPATRAFYRALAREAERQGWLSLHGLFSGGRLTAFHFGLRQGGRYFLPKPAYDEALGACSPGQLLMAEVLERCRSRGLFELDFLGPSMPWKLDWTDRQRRHAWYWIYAPTARGEALRLARAVAAGAAGRWKRQLAGRFPWRLPWRR